MNNTERAFHRLWADANNNTDHCITESSSPYEFDVTTGTWMDTDEWLGEGYYLIANSKWMPFINYFSQPEELLALIVENKISVESLRFFDIDEHMSFDINNLPYMVLPDYFSNYSGGSEFERKHALDRREKILMENGYVYEFVESQGYYELCYDMCNEEWVDWTTIDNVPTHLEQIYFNGEPTCVYMAEEAR